MGFRVEGFGIRDKSDYVRDLLYSYFAIITGQGVPLTLNLRLS